MAEPIYDYDGAMYFAVAVILLYGISIALLIGTTLRNHPADDEVKGFLRSYASLDDRKYAKQRCRKALREKNLLSMISESSMVAMSPGAGVGAVLGLKSNPYVYHPCMRSPRLDHIKVHILPDCEEEIAEESGQMTESDSAEADDANDTDAESEIHIGSESDAGISTEDEIDNTNAEFADVTVPPRTQGSRQTPIHDNDVRHVATRGSLAIAESMDDTPMSPGRNRIDIVVTDSNGYEQKLSESGPSGSPFRRHPRIGDTSSNCYRKTDSGDFFSDIEDDRYYEEGMSSVGEIFQMDASV